MPVSDAWIDFIAGWCSGAVATVACQPVDTILTRWQAGLVAVQPATAAMTTTTAPTASVVAAMAKQLTQSRGVFFLWRGTSPLCLAVPLQNSLLMGGYGVGSRYAEQYDKHKHAAIFVGGCTGGVLQSFLMSPVELIKVSQQCAGQPLQRAVAQVTTKLYEQAAWRGLGATLLRDGIPHGVWFWSYEIAKDDLNARLDHDPVLVPIVSGAFAATTAWGVGYPADIIKTRIQNGSSAGIMDTAKILIQEAHGNVLQGLYRGFGLKLVRAVPSSMIGFSVYEFVKRQIETI